MKKIILFSLIYLGGVGVGYFWATQQIWLEILSIVPVYIGATWMGIYHTRKDLATLT